MHEYGELSERVETDVSAAATAPRRHSEYDGHKRGDRLARLFGTSVGASPQSVDRGLPVRGGIGLAWRSHRSARAQFVDHRHREAWRDFHPGRHGEEIVCLICGQIEELYRRGHRCAGRKAIGAKPLVLRGVTKRIAASARVRPVITPTYFKPLLNDWCGEAGSLS